jgi:hypothetical protein
MVCACVRACERETECIHTGGKKESLQLVLRPREAHWTFHPNSETHGLHISRYQVDFRSTSLVGHLQLLLTLSSLSQ